MGSGSRFKVWIDKEVFGFGLAVSRFPYRYTIFLHIGIVSAELGLGRAYDD